MLKYLVYKLTSPSGKHYIGYTSKTLEERIRVHKNDRQHLINKGKKLPRFYAAWNKYPIEKWAQEILYTTTDKKKAQLTEQQEIQKHQTLLEANGYNMAKGGDGGNTGRNGEKWKRQKHSKFLKELYENDPARRNRSSQQSKKRMQKLKQDPLKFEKFCKSVSEAMSRGKDHQNFTGYWIVRHNKYETIVEAAKTENLNEWTVNEYCNNSDKVFKRDCALGKKGQTRREAGFYRMQEKL